MINVCVPVLKRYDLLHDLLLSLKQSDPLPTTLYVIDNGKNTKQLLAALDAETFPVRTHRPPVPMGVAESWNWFIQHVPDDRIITNDDVLFAPDSLKRLVASKADLAWAAGCGFSCYLLRDACVEKIGLFDETISPGYGYYEDEDYLQRLDGRGTRAPSAIAEEVVCGVQHLKSQTLKMANHQELVEHHRKFKIAQTNYIKKHHLEETFR
jgi:hypothetical protein